MPPCKNRKTDRDSGIDETGCVSISVRQGKFEKQRADAPLTFNEGEALFAERMRVFAGGAKKGKRGVVWRK